MKFNEVIFLLNANYAVYEIAASRKSDKNNRYHEAAVTEQKRLSSTKATLNKVKFEKRKRII